MLWLSNGEKNDNLASVSWIAELHRRRDPSVQVTTTAPMPTNNIVVFPRIYTTLEKS